MSDDQDSDAGARSRAKVSLGLSGDGVVPQDVTSVVGVKPSSAHAKDEVYRIRDRELRRPWGVWECEVVDDDVERATLELLNMLEPRAEALRSAARNANATISAAIWWEPEGGQGGYTIPSVTMHRLCALVDRIDYYFA